MTATGPSLESILDLVREEHERQNVKWGADRRDLSLLGWHAVIGEEIGEVATEAMDDCPDAFCVEAVQVAAAAVNAVRNVRWRQATTRGA